MSRWLMLLLVVLPGLSWAQVYRRAIPSGPGYYAEPRRYIIATPTPGVQSAAATDTTRRGADVITRPTLIKSTGSFVLGSNVLAASDATTAAIVIASSDVTLDLAGFTIQGRGATSPDAVGIAILADRVTIRNGSLSGFNAENQCAVLVAGGVRSFLLSDLKIAQSDTGILLNPDNQEINPVVGGVIDRCVVDGGSVGILGFESQGVTIRNSVVTGAAARRQVAGEGSGVLLRGSSYLLDGCNLSGSTHGLRLDASFSLVRGCSFSANRNTGATVLGRGNQLQDCQVSGNGLIGVSVLGENNSFVNDQFSGNGGHGLSLDKSGETGANHTYIKDCVFLGNSGEGLSDKGMGDTHLEGGAGGPK